MQTARWMTVGAACGLTVAVTLLAPREAHPAPAPVAAVGHVVAAARPLATTVAAPPAALRPAAAARLQVADLVPAAAPAARSWATARLSSVFDRMVEAPQHLNDFQLIHSVEFNPRGYDSRGRILRMVGAVERHQPRLARSARVVRETVRRELEHLAGEGALREVYFRRGDLSAAAVADLDDYVARRASLGLGTDPGRIDARIQAVGRRELRVAGLLRTEDDRLLWAPVSRLARAQDALRAFDDARAAWFAGVAQTFVDEGLLHPDELAVLHDRLWREVAARRERIPPLR